jgi:protein-disulfide isomerase
VLIEFSDFECRYCARFALETWPDLERQYVETGKIRVAFLNAPGPSHAQAEKAAEAAECAGREGKFWEMRAAIFEQGALAEARLRDVAASLGLEMGAFERCLAGEATAKVRADAAVAREVSLGGTPTFFVGILESDGQVRVIDRISGARPIADFQRALDKVVAMQTAGI